MTESDWFVEVCTQTAKLFLTKQETVNVGRWHSMDVSDNPLLRTREILNMSFDLEIPSSVGALKDMIKPNLPWAEKHFQERVSGIPWNPPPSHVEWPWSHANAQHQDEQQKFSHTYPERFWARRAWNWSHGDALEAPPGFVPAYPQGIRFNYGDLVDVMDLLIREPLTRQAYLPVWFPEDTGAAHGERVPCTLGYHFLRRDGQTQITYYIRSCDFVRYFRDDVYLAARLLQWVCERTRTQPGRLYFHCVSLHCLEGDVPKLRKEYENA